MSNFNEKKADSWRFYGNCGRCKEDKFFIKRLIVHQHGIDIISPSHFCKSCYKKISAILNK